jgi:hypothetical protein
MSQLGMFSEELAPTPLAPLPPSRAITAINAALKGEFPGKVRDFVLQHLRANGAKSGEDLVDAMLEAGINPPKGDGRSFGPSIGGMHAAMLIEPYGDGSRRKGNGTRGATIWRITAKGLKACP